MGTLREVNGLWSFQYSQAWLNNPFGYALSPSLPLVSEPQLDGASQRPVQWCFDNLLPEEGALQTMTPVTMTNGWSTNELAWPIQHKLCVSESRSL